MVRVRVSFVGRGSAAVVCWGVVSEGRGWEGWASEEGRPTVVAGSLSC